MVYAGNNYFLKIKIADKTNLTDLNISAKYPFEFFTVFSAKYPFRKIIDKFLNSKFKEINNHQNSFKFFKFTILNNVKKKTLKI